MLDGGEWVGERDRQGGGDSPPAWAGSVCGSSFGWSMVIFV